MTKFFTAQLETVRQKLTNIGPSTTLSRRISGYIFSVVFRLTPGVIILFGAWIASNSYRSVREKSKLYKTYNGTVSQSMNLHTDVIEGDEIKVAPLETIDFNRILSKEPAEVSKMLQCSQNRGFFYLDLQNDCTDPIFTKEKLSSD